MKMIIVGGGMAGATLALAVSALSGGRVGIDLVEAASPFAQTHPGFDARAIALAHGTCQQLARIGVWQALHSCATPIDSVHISDSGHAGFVTLHASDYQIAALGQVVELHQVGSRLFHLLEQAPGITLHCPARVIDVQRAIRSATVILDNGTQLNAELLVAADGSTSPLAHHCQMQWQTREYQQVAVIANVLTSEPHCGRAFERFTAHGPLAMLPMSDGRSSLVWCHAMQEQHVVDSWDEAEFLRRLQLAFGWRLGTMLHAGARYSYPLRLTRAERHISHRLALVGNAAQTLHPIAGQGFNLGLRDVMSLAETVTSAALCGEDIGSYRVLAEYQRRRAPDQRATINITDNLVHLFANRLAPLVVGRNLGLMVMELTPLLRDALARHMLGWNANVPVQK